MEDQPTEPSEFLPWLKRNGAAVVVLIVVAAYLTQTHYGIARHVAQAVGRRVNASNLPGILSATAWPTAFLLAVTLLWQPLIRLLDSLEEIIWGDKKAKFSNKKILKRMSQDATASTNVAAAEADAGAAPAALGGPAAGLAAAPAAGPAIFPDKIASVFWAGTDLTLASNIILNGVDRATILGVLMQGIHHVRASGMKGSALHIRLQSIYDEIARSQEKDLTRGRREDFAREIYASAREFGEVAIKLQPNFSGSPDTSR